MPETLRELDPATDLDADAFGFWRRRIGQGSVRAVRWGGGQATLKLYRELGLLADGDWIVKYADGEYDVVPHEHFVQTYERVE